MSSARRILITPRSVTTEGHPSLERLRAAGFEVVMCTPGKQPTADELLRLLPGCVGYLAGVEPVSARVLAAAGELKVISRNGAGVDNIDLDAARRRGITICRAEGANARGVAELAIALVLALVRAIPFSDRSIKAGGWDRRNGIELAGLTMGVIGCGRIGRIVARLVCGLDMNVLGFDVVTPGSSELPATGFRLASLDECMARSDVISLHCPPGKRPIINAEVLATTKRGVYVVNTARASLVDARAMLSAIERGQVAGYATDVFEHEPPGDDPLLASDRVITTAHIGGYTKQSVDRAMSGAVENLLVSLTQGG